MNSSYDDWRLGNGETIWDCENCTITGEEEEFEEYSWYDADRDRQCKFLCRKCIDRIEEGDV